VTDWQPIETAPRNGTCVLLRRKVKTTRRDFHREVRARWRDRTAYGPAWIPITPHGLYLCDADLDRWPEVIGFGSVTVMPAVSQARISVPS
jgi:hypothetical protein